MNLRLCNICYLLTTYLLHIHYNAHYITSVVARALVIDKLNSKFQTGREVSLANDSVTRLYPNPECMNYDVLQYPSSIYCAYRHACF